MTKEGNKLYYWTSTFCIDNDAIWFIYGKLCVLYKYTISTKENKIIGVVPVDNPMQENLFQKIILIKNKLFLIPCWANDIVTYDLTTDRFDTIKIKLCSGLKFSGAYVYKNKIICMPASYEYVVGINIYDLTIDYEYNVEKIKEQEHIEYFNLTDRLDNRKIALCSPQSGKIYIYDIEKRILKSESMCKGERGNEFILCIGGQMIVLCNNRNHQIVMYNYGTKQIENIFWPNGKKQVAIFRLDDKIVIDDYETSWVGIYNKEFKLLTEAEDNIVKNRKYYYSYLVGSCESGCGQNIYFNNCDMSFNWFQNGLFKEKVHLPISERDKNYIKENLYLRDSVNNAEVENYFYRLSDFLEKIL